MPIPVQPGRLDLLLLALMEQVCKTHVDSRLPVPVWSEGVARELAKQINQAGIPQPVTHVQVGQLRVPLGVVQWLGQVAGIFPRQIGGGA